MVTTDSGFWISRHSPRLRLARHRHVHGYVSVVLAGGYVEAGDGPRIRTQPGDVIVHAAFEAHQDDFGNIGSAVLNLPLAPGLPVGAGRVADADAVVRAAARDPLDALLLIRETLVRESARDHCVWLNDWPDQLALALRGTDNVALGRWARDAGLAPQSLSRSFRQCYGVSPKRYRLEQRTRRALERLPSWHGSLAALAAEVGFADQAHLTRAVSSITGLPPSRLRVQSVQATPTRLG